MSDTKKSGTFNAAVRNARKQHPHAFAMAYQILILAMILVLAEIFVFNGARFGRHPFYQDIPLNNTVTEGGAEPDGDALKISGATNIVLRGFPEETGAVIIGMDPILAGAGTPATVTLAITDDNFPTSYQTVHQIFTTAPDGTCGFSFEPYGHAHSIRVSITPGNVPVTVRSITVAQKLPFHFSLLRYFGLLAIGVLVLVIRERALYRVRYNRRKLSHRLIAQGMVILCACTMLLYQRPADKPQRYDPALDYAWDPYAATLKAVNLGQTVLDLPPDPKIAEISDVYSRDVRDSSDAFVLWDYAYYNGSYYCYFGITPVLTYYLPYYRLTDYVPSMAMACTFFGFWAVFFLCETILAAVHLTVPRPNLLLLLLCMAGAVCSVGLYYEANLALRYNVVILSGMCFLFLCLWTGLTALRLQKRGARYALLAVSGLSLSLTAASRPDLALEGAVLIPFFVGLLRDKHQTMQYRVMQALFFLVPLLIGGGALMWYNDVRFGSPFDFGSGYQLTVSNVQANSIRLKDLPWMLWHYFLQFPRPSKTFPYFEYQFTGFGNYGHYTFNELAVGAFTYPMIPLGLLLLPRALRRKNSYVPGSVTAVQRNAFLLTCLGMALLIGFLDYCMGGVAQRYVSCMMPMLVLVTVISLLRTAGGTKRSKLLYGCTVAAILVTVIVVWLLQIGLQDSSLIRTVPGIHDTVRDLIEFWD